MTTWRARTSRVAMVAAVRRHPSRMRGAKIGEMEILRGPEGLSRLDLTVL